MLTTHIQTQKANAAAIDKKVMELLNWNEDQYTYFKFSNGLSFLICYFGSMEAVNFQEYRKEYWNWWKNQWYLRDIVFVENFDAEMPHVHHITCYRTIHNPKILSCEIYPDANLLGSKFEKVTDIIEFLKAKIL